MSENLHFNYFLMGAAMDHSREFENIGMNVAFEQVLLDNLLERQDELTIDKVSVPKVYVSEDLNVMHGMPYEFTFHDFKTTLISCPDTADRKDDWCITTTYKLNDNKYVMKASKELVIATFYDSEGKAQERKFPAGTGMNLIKTVALGVLRETGYKFDNAHFIPVPENIQDLRRLIKTIGNIKGRHDLRLSSYVPDISSINRGLLVKHTQTESPSESKMITNSRMIWKIGDGGSTEISSHQEFVNSSEFKDEGIMERYITRQPIDTDPKDLPFIFDSFGELESASMAMYTPEDRDLHYEIANTSIMTLLKPHLSKLVHLESQSSLDSDEFLNLEGPDSKI